MSSAVRLSSVCLSVSSVCRLSSVTLVHPTQAIEIFGNISTPCGTLAIHDLCTVCSKKSDAKIEIIITATNLIRIKYPLSILNYHLSGANVAKFNKIHYTVFEQQLFKKWSSKTEVSNMEKSPYQFVRNTTSYSLCSKWSPFAQTFACLLCRPYVLCC